VKHRDAVACIGILAVLLAVSAVPASMYRFRPEADTPAKKVFRTLQRRGLNREASAKQTAGYYEGLLEEAATVTEISGRGWLDWRFWLVERAERSDRATQYRVLRPDFLRYELKPNVNVADVDERRRTVTNSLGMMDREYSVAAQPGTYRIALIGDSLSQGVGAEFGASYESRLEDFLNSSPSRLHSRYEVLNFAVRGYQLTQLVDVGLSRVPPFAPDLYALALTERSVFSGWADHIATLVRNGVDLKYDYLRSVVERAELTPNMSPPMVNAALAPFRMDIMRWAFTAMRDHARQDGTDLVVLLVPSGDDPEIQIEQFEPVRRLLDELGVHTIDLLGTFAVLDDLGLITVSESDRHPNDEGHRMLFEALREKLDTSAPVANLFTGKGRRPRAGLDTATNQPPR
jgi:lysophospholipase L1-like esterase